MNKLTLNSYAKLNLYLEVLNKRKDNYHNIKTLFERIDLSDKIILTCRQDKKIRIITSSTKIPKDNSNLTYRAAELLQERLSIHKGVDIEIIKRIPVGSGMAGGSSNAAYVLMGLNKLWKLSLNKAQLCEFAQRLGSDVPFFIYNCPFALGEGKGERIRPQAALKNLRLWHILVVPRINVSTARVYQEWDRLRQSSKISQSVRLTSPGYDVKILILGLRKKDPAQTAKALFNSLEQVTTRLYPELIDIRERLIAQGLKSMLMSGSGPAIFAITSSRKEAFSVFNQLRRNRFWQVFVTRTH